jgi:hypothetical protein
MDRRSGSGPTGATGFALGEALSSHTEQEDRLGLGVSCLNARLDDRGVSFCIYPQEVYVSIRGKPPVRLWLYGNCRWRRGHLWLQLLCVSPEASWPIGESPSDASAKVIAAVAI